MCCNKHIAKTLFHIAKKTQNFYACSRLQLALLAFKNCDTLFLLIQRLSNSRSLNLPKKCHPVAVGNIIYCEKLALCLRASFTRGRYVDPCGWKIHHIEIYLDSLQVKQWLMSSIKTRHTISPRLAKRLKTSLYQLQTEVLVQPPTLSTFGTTYSDPLRFIYAIEYKDL